MAKPATKTAAPVAAPKAKKGTGKHSRAKNPERQDSAMAKAARAKLSGEKKRAWAAANPDKLPSKKADWYSNRKARRAAWRAANPDAAARKEDARLRKEQSKADAQANFDKGVSEIVSGRKPKKPTHKTFDNQSGAVHVPVGMIGIPVGSAMVVAGASGAGKSVVAPGAPVTAGVAAARAAAMMAAAR